MPTLVFAVDDAVIDQARALVKSQAITSPSSRNLGYTENGSNNELYQFDRYMLSVTVRKDFRW